MTLGGYTLSQSIFEFKLAFFPCLAGTKIMADELELVAIATETSLNVPCVPRDLVHLGLRQRAVVVILAVRAATTTRLSFIALHGLAKRSPIFRISATLVAGLFWAKHPVVNDGLRVLLVLGCCDERFAFTNAAKPTDHNHWLFHDVISRPDARMVNAEAALAFVRMDAPASRT
jgi:hypothetical protein